MGALNFKYSIKKNLTLGDLKILIKQKIAPELFDLSYDYVGDLAETISLLWPKNDSTFTKLIYLNLWKIHFY